MKITVDDALRTRLHDFRLPLELCDESGRVLGYLRPAADPSLYKGVHCPVSEAELDRRSQMGGGRPLADVLRDLESQG
jgi:hypothetical protein